jgi:2-methylcitrate dehydratase PrpD
MKRRAFLRAAAGAGSGMMFAPKLLGAVAPSCAPPFPHAADVTRHVSQFVAGTQYSSLPAELIELGKKSILDGLGLALAGSAADSGRITRAYLQQAGFRDGEAVVAGSNMKVPPRFAAFANGTSIHADDFDDTQLAAAKDRVYGLLTHPTVAVLASVLAVGAERPCSGKELMLAYHLGVEVECKIAEAIAPRHYEDGFHSTGTCGAIGAAAACAQLRGFTAPQVATTLGIAASQAAGLRENFGTMMKPFHAGHAAEIGVLSADLAGLGWTAASDILEAPRGFFRAYGGSYDPAVMAKLAAPWTLISPGVSIKPYPSGSLTHPAMTELSRLIRAKGIIAAQVERVDVGTNRNMPNVLIHHRPETGLEAKFSMEFCVAILLLEGRAGLAQFTDEVVRRPDVREMIRRVNFYVDPEAERAGYDKMTTVLKIHLKNGETVAGRADFAKGSPGDPMSYQDVAEKFSGCAEYAAWDKGQAASIVERVRGLEAVGDVRELAQLLARGARKR